MKKNKRKMLKKKQRHWENVEKRHMDELYKQARIDPNTLEGQSVLPIEDLNITNEIKLRKPNGLLSFFGF